MLLEGQTIIREEALRELTEQPQPEWALTQTLLLPRHLLLLKVIMELMGLVAVARLLEDPQALRQRTRSISKCRPRLNSRQHKQSRQVGLSQEEER
jgi:hypothetical protein